MDKPKFEFYQRMNGHVEFTEFLATLPDRDTRDLLLTIQKVENIGLMHAQRVQWVKKLDTNLYEIRSRNGKSIHRALYFHVAGSQYVITHGFTKKTQRTPQKEITHEKQLRNEYLSGGNHG
ncbi:type II toxin-antitoxin system RelE/ParE family toxin [Levilactobacillus acidifarinae]|uniref:type II toxin-antitoxin system RelE/ParE family toxin n=1 Tax=Levilactobacillus acidifarinae TaxID=267364 RepID=UPI0007106D4C|nr:type II toxin-antitoxin system RelE/ParE family toxin [Levilactobacillus acidifarinae]